ncbi:MAG: acyl-CoA dehydrogenase [Candidatus Berkiellales bacterium]
MIALSIVIFCLTVFWGIAFWRVPLWVWSPLIAILIYLSHLLGWMGPSVWIVLPLYLIVFIPLNIPWLRSQLFTKYVFSWFRSVLPAMSQTEKEAIEAGEVWWEKELFQGKPQWKKLLAMPKAHLTPEEQAFLDNQVETLCGMLDDWKIVHEDCDLPAEVWEYIKKEGFLGMIIPKQYGGLEYGPNAHSCVITKIATRSISAAVTVMVPNALGPGELLLQYGTTEQKEYYLPRLAKGIDIPCFALTGPEAGSDASAIPDSGVVCKGIFEGTEVTGIRLNFDKRYITLAPVATVIGLAFKMFDPDGLLGDKTDLGITLCLIPKNHPGVSTGARHLPLNLAFMNGPVRGVDVFIPLDWIIGGSKMIGQGWRMLMECLAAGRGISLPALSTASGMLACRMTSAYATIRRQFNLSIAQFEGVEKVLAQIIGHTYLLEATRVFTVLPLENHIRPAVATAIAKYNMTELARKVVNDAMDIHGGRGIMMGPNNYIGRGYQALPISITVEGANILTRNLIIFGQGAIRCHPYVKEELKAVELFAQNKRLGIKHFDKNSMKHVGYCLSNFARCFGFSLSLGRLSFVNVSDGAKFYLKKINWMSAALSVCADVALLTLGGDLKRKENISARLGDILSQLYLASATLKYYHDEGRQKSEWPMVEWILQNCLVQIQNAFFGFFQNYPHKVIGSLLKWFTFPYGKVFSPPKDKLAQQMVHTLQSSPECRLKMTHLCFVGKTGDDQTGLIEVTFNQLMSIQGALEKISRAIKKKEINKQSSFEQQIQTALDLNIIDQNEAHKIKEFDTLRKRAISVDEFPLDYALGSKQHARD